MVISRVCCRLAALACCRARPANADDGSAPLCRPAIALRHAGQPIRLLHTLTRGRRVLPGGSGRPQARNGSVQSTGTDPQSLAQILIAPAPTHSLLLGLSSDVVEDLAQLPAAWQLVLWRSRHFALASSKLLHQSTHDLIRVPTAVPRQCLRLVQALLRPSHKLVPADQFKTMTGMDATSNAPFVNRDLLARYVQRRVRLAGAVESMDDSSIRVKASDDGMVTVKLRGPSSFDDKYVLLEGVVDSPDTIIEDAHTNFGNNFGAFNCGA